MQNTPSDASNLESQHWYIEKRPSKQCEILFIPPKEAATSNDEALQRWGPFKTKNQAIAKRVGLIRAGKCKPI